MKEALKRLNKEEKRVKRNFNILLLVALFSGVLLIVSVYAWFNASLDVKVKFFNMIVSDESGLFISLDGVNYDNFVEISRASVIKDLKKTYPNHTNQWAHGGMYPVSTNGIATTDDDKFNVFGSYTQLKRKGSEDRWLKTIKAKEDYANDTNLYIAFDLFLKNVSGSPFPDNLFMVDGTSIELSDGETNTEDGTLNSMRLGMVRIDSVSSQTPSETVQNLKCRNQCEMMIFEPHSLDHSEDSTLRAEKYGMTIKDGEYIPTYGVIKAGEKLEMANGQAGSGIPLDTEHFALQQTITNFDNPLFSLPNGVTKFRVYVWLEGQDLDSLETVSKGATIRITINFYKDLAGYY